MTVRNFSIENARIGFRNFSGKEGKFNPAGRRNFCVFLEDDIAYDLAKIGWNIKWLQPRNEEDARQAYLQITVSYENKPPKILMITSNGKTVLNEESVGILDWAEIIGVDLIVNPYSWDVNGKQGIKAYVRSMYVTIAEDEFEAKYTNPPDSTMDTVGGCGECDACDGTCGNHATV